MFHSEDLGERKARAQSESEYGNLFLCWLECWTWDLGVPDGVHLEPHLTGPEMEVRDGIGSHPGEHNL